MELNFVARTLIRLNLAPLVECGTRLTQVLSPLEFEHIVVVPVIILAECLRGYCFSRPGKKLNDALAAVGIPADHKRIGCNKAVPKAKMLCYQRACFVCCR